MHQQFSADYLLKLAERKAFEAEKFIRYEAEVREAERKAQEFALLEEAANLEKEKEKEKEDARKKSK